jgi:thiol:disulfide interchange protein
MSDQSDTNKDAAANNNLLQQGKSENEAQTGEHIPPTTSDIPSGMKEIMLSMAGFSGPVTSPLQRKINEEHISKVLEIADKDSQRSYDDAQSSKRYFLAYIVLSFLLFGFIIVFLADKNPTLLRDILFILGAFAGGFGAGYGIKAHKDKDE